MSILTAAEELVENILGSVEVGEFAVVQPLSMEHCCILGYLLSWKLLLIFFKAAPSQVWHLSHSEAQLVFFCLHSHDISFLVECRFAFQTDEHLCASLFNVVVSGFYSSSWDDVVLQLRVQYCLHLKKTRSLHKLLLHLFRLMPENPTLPGQLAETASREPKSFFTESLSLSLHREYILI